MYDFYNRLSLAIGKTFPRPLFNAVLKIREFYKHFMMPEKRKSYETFFVIRLFPPASGFLANYIYVLGYMKYAYDRGWIPVVDMENYYTNALEEDAVNGTKNVWEYFFKQPCEYPPPPYTHTYL